MVTGEGSERERVMEWTEPGPRKRLAEQKWNAELGRWTFVAPATLADIKKALAAQGLRVVEACDQHETLLLLDGLRHRLEAMRKRNKRDAQRIAELEAEVERLRAFEEEPAAPPIDPEHQALVGRAVEERVEGTGAGRPLRSVVPVPMVLHCPACGTQHVDAPEPERQWTNPPHRSHLCHSCGHVWRPADVATVGVDAIATKGKADSPPAMNRRPVVPMEAIRELWEAVKAVNAAAYDSTDEVEAVVSLYELCRGKHRDTFSALDQPGAVIVAASEDDDADALRTMTTGPGSVEFWGLVRAIVARATIRSATDDALLVECARRAKDRWAMLLDAAQRDELPDAVVFCDVGDTTLWAWVDDHRHDLERIVKEADRD